MTRSHSLLVLLAHLFGSYAAAQVTTDWVRPLRGLSIALDRFDNVYTVDYAYALGGDITLTKMDHDGVELWQATYDQTSTTRFDQATWVTVDQQDNAIVSGTVKSGYSNPVNANSLLMKFNPDGELLWRVVYEQDFDASSTRKCLVDRTGNIYVLGSGIGPNGLVTKVKKFASDGSAAWSWFDAEGIGGPTNIKFTPDSNLVISARGTTGSINGYAKIDRDGNTIWSLAGVISQTVGDAAGDGFGNTYIVNENHPSGAGSTIRKLAANGAEIWRNDFAITAFRVEVGNDEAPVVCGFPYPGNGGSAFLKADAAGEQLWSIADADGPNNFLLHAQLMLDPANNAYLCAGTLFSMGVCKVNSDGTSAWYITAGTGGSQGFALGADQNVYVTGGATLRLGQNIGTGSGSEIVRHGSGLLAFPNPASSGLTIVWDGHVMERWRILSVQGSVLMAGRGVINSLDLSALPSGSFLLEVVDRQGTRATTWGVKDH